MLSQKKSSFLKFYGGSENKYVDKIKGEHDIIRYVSKLNVMIASCKKALL